MDCNKSENYILKGGGFMGFLKFIFGIHIIGWIDEIVGYLTHREKN